MSTVTHLECGLSGERLPAGQLATVSAVGKPLLVRYDLDRIRREVDRDNQLVEPTFMSFAPAASGD